MRVVSCIMMSCDLITLEQCYNIHHLLLNSYVLQVRNLCSCVKVAEDFVSPEVSCTNDFVLFLQNLIMCKTYMASAVELLTTTFVLLLLPSMCTSV